ncbi:cupin domain-containing protein [Pseudomonas matsuisoli]|uniref:Cupin type-1 domain-containing protein n=1 Tax=Pseudomonas matsuisoli TaxID=1515666 RepID=A0A917PY08_9PSED|nr:cupin domain-containing protein [Pseudomonas matsuisoli]GGJ98188.1 hypothetical protein GCM10009304_25150 [Pseudomonas matsuisoli]
MSLDRRAFNAVLFALSLAPNVAALGAPARNEKPEQLRFKDDGKIPNSPYPTLVYRDLPLEGDKAAAFEKLFAANGWPPQWRYGIFTYHHYHPNAHEVLGVASGSARVMLGGESGQEVSIAAGDVLVLPAGTGHCCLESSDDFLVVGAYPEGQADYDTERADASVHAASLARIAQVAMPMADPVTGKDGALLAAWRTG